MARQNSKKAAVRALLSAAFAVVPLAILSVVAQALFEQVPLSEAFTRLGYLAAFSSFLLLPLALIYIGAYILACKLPFRDSKVTAFLVGTFAFLALAILPLGISIWLDMHGAIVINAPGTQAASIANAVVFWIIGATICGGTSVLAQTLLPWPTNVVRPERQ